MQKKRKLSSGHKLWRVVKKTFLWIIISHLVYIIITKWLNPPVTVTQISEFIKGNGLNRNYIAYEDMGYNIKLAVLSGEDQLFPQHNGFDLKHIKLAIEYNEKHPRKTRGASTISQQTAKNVFLWQGGGWFRKGLETYFTFMIENIWNKKRILETYLNVAEMGKGVFGVQAAAKLYFNKNAKDLTRFEAAQIAACLPNPKKYTVKPLSKYVSLRSTRLLNQMKRLEASAVVKTLIKD